MSRDRSGSAAKYQSEVDERLPNTHTIALGLTGTDRKVLELGCATGHVTRALKRRGHTVVAVEIDPASAALAREVADDVIVADLDATPLTDVVAARDFDVVLMGDVLEHLRDPLTVLREAEQTLAPGGCAVISLPNVAFADVRLALLDGLWEYCDDGLLDRTHLRFFTRASMFRFVSDAGLVVTEYLPVLRPHGTSNVQPADPILGRAVAEHLRNDPNASVYVFVVKAERATGEALERAHQLAARLDQVDAEARERLRSVTNTSVHDLQLLEENRRELLALKNTRLFRLAAGPRRVYARLRRIPHRSTA